MEYTNITLTQSAIKIRAPITKTHQFRAKITTSSYGQQSYFTIGKIKIANNKTARFGNEIINCIEGGRKKGQSSIKYSGASGNRYRALKIPYELSAEIPKWLCVTGGVDKSFCWVLNENYCQIVA